ncbi:Hypothetical protein D9617_1g088740 [Elsinoe fawcettii]|nr:Hypothetical protein D9617_1g088740 [Elsinoe fawcettii]
MVRWKSLIENPELRQYPLHITIYTAETRLGHQINLGLYDDFWVDIIQNKLARLPCLSSIELHFTPECKAPDAPASSSCVEDWVERHELLRVLFAGLAKVAMSGEHSPIKDLTISNLQNAVLRNLIGTPIFKTTMSALNRLQLRVSVEEPQYFPLGHQGLLGSSGYWEWGFFPMHMADAWLVPASSNLTSLSLYFDKPWGSLPGKFEALYLDFPALKSLALGAYSMAYDDGIDWVVRCKKLRQLTLHACTIVVLINVDDEMDQSWTFDHGKWRHVHTIDSCEYYAYLGRWHQVFDKIRDHLPDLQDFCFNDDDGHWISRGFFEREYYEQFSMST